MHFILIHTLLLSFTQATFFTNISILLARSFYVCSVIKDFTGFLQKASTEFTLPGSVSEFHVKLTSHFSVARARAERTEVIVLSAANSAENTDGKIMIHQSADRLQNSSSKTC